MAAAEKVSIADLAERLILERCKTFCQGKIAGQKESHQRTLAAINSIGRPTHTCVDNPELPCAVPECSPTTKGI